jgi:hypothetical protein
MKITKQNYEEYALDYIEGTLSAEDRQAFARFLDSHPDIAADIKGLQEEMPVLIPDLSVTYTDKPALKRKASLRPIFLRIGAVAAVLLAGVFIFTRLGQDADTLKNPAPIAHAEGEKEVVIVPETTQTNTQEPASTLNLADATQTPRPAIKTPESTATPTVQTTGRTNLALDPVEIQPAPASALKGSREVLTNSVNESNQIREVFTRPKEEAVAQPVIETKQQEQPVVIENTAPDTLSEAVYIAEAPRERVISVTEEFVVESTNEPVVFTRDTRDYFAEEENSAGLLNGSANRRGLRRLASGILTPLSILSPIKVSENNEERVVEFASITISRRPIQTEEIQ